MRVKKRSPFPAGFHPAVAVGAPELTDLVAVAMNHSEPPSRPPTTLLNFAEKSRVASRATTLPHYFNLMLLVNSYTRKRYMLNVDTKSNTAWFVVVIKPNTLYLICLPGDK